MGIPTPENEVERIAALKRHDILDTPPEEVFDRITRTVSEQLDVPFALVSLVDESRQWFKSRHGLELVETPREVSFCAHAILGTGPMVIEDLAKDARFEGNPFVAGPPGIRFYAGVPLRTRDSHNLGTLCAIDLKPRTLTGGQLRMLTDLAAVVMDVLDLRQAARSVVADERSAARSAARLSEDRTRELHASEERFQDITSNVPGIVYQFRIDAQGRPSFPYVSATIRDLLGLDPSDVLRDPDTWFDIIHPDDRADLDRSIAESYGTLEPWHWEGRVIRASGEVGWFRGSSTPRRIDDGSVLWNGLVSDITALKQTEEHLHQAQKMEAVGQLTGGVAHDFNNLLAVIMGNADVLEDQLGSESVALDAIFRAATRGAELTQRLLAFSRQQPLRPRAIDLDALVSGMSELLARSLGATIEIATGRAADLWLAAADPGQVENALLNLALNARDAMPAGGRLSIECGNERLDHAYVSRNPEAMAGEFAVLAVSDEGLGMSAEVQAQAFEPFFTTKEVGQGSGLGLSMVYGFAKQSGGHVTILSNEGRGTTVKLYLPRAECANECQDAPQRQEIPLGQGERILVIEDDPDVRDLVIRMLGGLDYRFDVVADAAAADEALATGAAVDLVLSDVILPGGTSGPEFAGKAREQYPGLKIVFMSGYPAEAERYDGLVGPDKVLLNKPFTRRQLAKLLRQALD